MAEALSAPVVSRSVPAVELADVSFRYPRAAAPILRDVSLRIPAGTSVALMGANGTGKTTLLRLMAGLVAPTSGTVRTAAGRVGYIPQQVGLVGRLSVEENVLHGALSRAGAWQALTNRFSDADRSRARRAIEDVGLAGREEEPVARLSGGQRRRVAIARALVQEPELLLADEFLANLDVAKAAELLDLARSLQRSGVTVVLAMHDLVLAKGAVDRIAFLRDGTIGAVVPSGHVTAEQVRWYLGHA
ncbi:MAG TPA: ATP-binding cassette domain-containing protein [Candidatus Thermoplasmatota archaeon]|nr:ATP-binding cassette domain-containing protein [Candidatus Thermoplasmatota archaeon]